MTHFIVSSEFFARHGCRKPQNRKSLLEPVHSNDQNTTAHSRIVSTIAHCMTTRTTGAACCLTLPKLKWSMQPGGRLASDEETSLSLHPDGLHLFHCLPPARSESRFGASTRAKQKALTRRARAKQHCAIQ